MSKKRPTLSILSAMDTPAPTILCNNIAYTAEPYIWDGHKAEQTYSVGPLRLLVYPVSSMMILVEVAQKPLDLGHSFDTPLEYVLAGVVKLCDCYNWNRASEGAPPELTPEIFQTIDAIFTEHFGFHYLWLSHQFSRDMAKAFSLLEEITRSVL